MAEILGAQDLTGIDPESTGAPATPVGFSPRGIGAVAEIGGSGSRVVLDAAALDTIAQSSDPAIAAAGQVGSQVKVRVGGRSEEHTSELQSLMSISYAVIGLTKKIQSIETHHN